MIKNFKPNLIPNNPKDDSFTKEDRNKIIERNGGIENYIISYKKDGCRLELGLAEQPLSRSLKIPQSTLVLNRFKRLNELCIRLNIVLDGEFYMHGESFNTIFSFFSNTDVTRDSYKQQLEKEFRKNPIKFKNDYNNRSIEFLTTFHKNFKFWLFDGIVLDRLDLVGFNDRMLEIHKRLLRYNLDSLYIELFDSTSVESYDELDYLYKTALSSGWEGLVLTHKDHEYKFGRNSLNQGTLLKMKDDAIEYDGVILDIPEGTNIKEDVERGINELGRSTTSQKKADREPSGKAKGFTIQFEDIGTFDVGLRGFDDEAKRELLENKENYIGRHFKYKAMAPVKDYPRHAYFDTWRDSKNED